LLQVCPSSVPASPRSPLSSTSSHPSRHPCVRTTHITQFLISILPQSHPRHFSTTPSRPRCRAHRQIPLFAKPHHKNRHGFTWLWSARGCHFP
jgi:hypothetical protein